MKPCICSEPHERRRIVLTGGPGAGKTAVLELIRQSFCEHVTVLPEAAGIIFGGGFPRGPGVQLQRAIQRAIFYVQRELEIAADADGPAIVLCDRGRVDGLAYWPSGNFWSDVHSSLEEQLDRYDAVIHLRTPGAEGGYNRENPQRIESAEEAADIDARIAMAWEAHPRRFFVEASPDFLTKAARVLAILRNELPLCCRGHVVPAINGGRSAADAPAPGGAHGSERGAPSSRLRAGS